MVFLLLSFNLFSLSTQSYLSNIQTLYLSEPPLNNPRLTSSQKRKILSEIYQHHHYSPQKNSLKAYQFKPLGSAFAKTIIPLLRIKYVTEPQQNQTQYKEALEKIDDLFGYLKKLIIDNYEDSVTIGTLYNQVCSNTSLHIPQSILQELKKWSLAIQEYLQKTETPHINQTLKKMDTLLEILSPIIPTLCENTPPSTLSKDKNMFFQVLESLVSPHPISYAKEYNLYSQQSSLSFPDIYPQSFPFKIHFDHSTFGLFGIHMHAIFQTFLFLETYFDELFFLPELIQQQKEHPHPDFRQLLTYYFIYLRHTGHLSYTTVKHLQIDLGTDIYDLKNQSFQLNEILAHLNNNSIDKATRYGFLLPFLPLFHSDILLALLEHCSENIYFFYPFRETTHALVNDKNIEKEEIVWHKSLLYHAVFYLKTIVSVSPSQHIRHTSKQTHKPSPSPSNIPIQQIPKNSYRTFTTESSVIKVQKKDEPDEEFYDHHVMLYIEREISNLQTIPYKFLKLFPINTQYKQLNLEDTRKLQKKINCLIQENYISFSFSNLSPSIYNNYLLPTLFNYTLTDLPHILGPSAVGGQIIWLFQKGLTPTGYYPILHDSRRPYLTAPHLFSWGRSFSLMGRVENSFLLSAHSFDFQDSNISTVLCDFGNIPIDPQSFFLNHGDSVGINSRLIPNCHLTLISNLNNLLEYLLSIRIAYSSFLSKSPMTIFSPILDDFVSLNLNWLSFLFEICSESKTYNNQLWPEFLKEQLTDLLTQEFKQWIKYLGKSPMFQVQMKLADIRTCASINLDSTATQHLFSWIQNTLLIISIKKFIHLKNPKRTLTDSSSLDFFQLENTPQTPFSFLKFLLIHSQSHPHLLQKIIEKVKASLFSQSNFIFFEGQTLSFKCLKIKLNKTLVVQIGDAVINEDNGYFRSIAIPPSSPPYPPQLLLIQHPFLNIPLLVQNDSQKHYVLSSFIEGTLLDDFNIRSLETSQQKTSLLTLFLALEELSFHGFFHNDLHIRNIIINEDSFLKLIDFELSDTMARNNPEIVWTDWFRIHRELLKEKFKNKDVWWEQFEHKFFLQYSENQEENNNSKAFNHTFQKICLWEGWKEELNQLKNQLPQSQINRLLSTKSTFALNTIIPSSQPSQEQKIPFIKNSPQLKKKLFKNNRILFSS